MATFNPNASDWPYRNAVQSPLVQMPPREAETWRDAALAGIEATATGLAISRSLPSTVLPEDAPWYHRLAANTAGVVVDLPLSIVGGVAGMVAGTAAGGPGVGTAVGGGAGAFAVPMGLREALMTAYAQDSARTWEDVWEIAKAGLIGGGKGAVIGGATFGAGKLAAPFVAGTGTAAKVGVPFAAELGTMTTASAVLSGRMPTAQEFMDNAILLGGLKGATHIAGNLRAIFAETGKAPSSVVGKALTDPLLKKALEGDPELMAKLKVEPGKPGEQPIVRLPEEYATLAIEERLNAAIGKDFRPEMLRAVLDEGQRESPTPFAELLAKAPAVKMEYLTTADDLKALSRKMEPFYEAEFTQQTRGVVPARVTVNNAIRKIAGLEPHEIGTAEPANVLAARAFTYQQASAYAMKIIKEQAAIPEADRSVRDNLTMYAALERAKMAYQHLRGSAAETGRALNILWQLKYRNDLIPEAKRLEAEFAKQMRSSKGDSVMTFGEMAKLADKLRDPVSLAEFSENALKATTFEKILYVWRSAILSGIQTHIANPLGNLGKLTLDIVAEKPIQTMITAARRALAGDPMSVTEFKAKALSPIIGLIRGTKDALVVAGEVWQGKGEHFEKADVFVKPFTGKADRVIGAPYRLLQMEDVLFRIPAERARAYEIAVDRALKESLTPGTKEFAARVDTYTQRPETGLTPEAASRMMEQIETVGGEAVFAQRLGPKMEQAQILMKGTPAQFIVPFWRTPINLLSWSVQHSPFFLLSERWRSDFAAGGVKMDSAIARVAVGTGLTMLALSAIENEVLSGGGHFDPEQRRTKMAAGWQPYSVKIGDDWYSYQRLEPIGKVIGLVADMMEMGSKTEEDASKQAMASVALFGNATISTTYMSGIASLFNSLTDPTRYFETFYEQYAASLVPKIIGQTAGLIDPHKREVDGIVDSIQSQIPFLREKLMPQRDIWGEPAKREWFAFVSPIAVTKEVTDKVKTEAMRLELAISDVPKTIFESGPLKAKERKIELTQEQHDVGREVSGKWAMSILAPIVNSRDWESIPDFAKATIYKRVIENARKIGKESAIPASSEVRESKRMEIVRELERQSGKVAPTPEQRITVR